MKWKMVSDFLWTYFHDFGASQGKEYLVCVYELILGCNDLDVTVQSTVDQQGEVLTKSSQQSIGILILIMKNTKQINK